MQTRTLDAATWAEEQFGECSLGDKRRTKRLVKLATQVAENPSAGFPEQTASWGDVKAAYRLFDADEVIFGAVTAPHWERTRAESPSTVLVVCDTTELDFGIHRQIDELGSTGNGGGWGCLLHSALMVEPDTEQVIGVAGQKIHYRQKAPDGENTTQRLARERESEIWGAVCDLVGPPPERAHWIYVCDRGADNFEIFVHFQQQRVDWVVRAAQLRRAILDPQGRERPLSEYLQNLPTAGTFELKLRSRPGQPARTAKLAVSFGSLQMPLPKQKSPYVRQNACGPIPMLVVHVQEVDAPPEVEPLEWVLYTSLPVTCFEEAVRIVSYYEKRWIIEEWHKAMKTGCRVTQRQLKTKERLEPMIGLMSIVAVRLLQLKAAARTTPNRPACGVVPELWVCLLCAARRSSHSPQEMTVGQFYRSLAQLGGFLGRKSDGDPGWITIWRGWEKLHLMLRGSELLAEAKALRQKCG